MAQTPVHKTPQEYLVLTLICVAMVAPLIVGSSFAVFPFIFPKVIYLEVVIGALAAVFIPTVLTKAIYNIRNIYAYLMAAYAAALGFAGIFAFDSGRAFWSNFERMTGIVFIWYAILFSVLVAAYFGAHSSKIKGFLGYLVGLSVFVSAAGIYQHVNSGFLMNQSTRVAGTFGNPIYLGGFCAQLLVLSLYLAYDSRIKWHRYFFVSAGIINLLALYYSGTRSAFAALGGALLIVGGYAAYELWKKGVKKTVVIGIGSLALAVAILFTLPRIVPSLHGTMLDRVTNFQDAFSTTGSTRLIAWNIAIKGFLERPVFGWGPENFYFVFNKFYNPRSLTFGSYETWFDHAHNAVFDVLVTQGVVGFVLYLLQYGLIFWMCYKVWGSDKKENLLSVVLASIFALHFIHNFFVFDHPGSYIEFYAFGGIVAARFIAWRRTQGDAPEGDKKPIFNHAPQYIIGAVIFVGTLLIVIPSYRQNHLDLLAQTAASVDLKITQKYFTEAAAINGPYTMDVLMDTGRVAQRIPVVVNGNQSFLTVQMFRDYYNFSLNSLDRLLSSVEPENVLAAIMKGQLLMNMVQGGDPAAYDRAEKAFQYATRLSPDRQQIAYSWANLKLYAKDVEGAKQLLEKANAKEPAIGVGHWYLALVYVDTDPGRAVQEIEAAALYEYDVRANSNRLFAGYAYSLVKKYDIATSYFEEALVKNYNAAEWNGEYILEADLAFSKVKRTDLQEKLRVLFPNAFSQKK